jgi:hypothetical protein
MFEMTPIYLNQKSTQINNTINKHFDPFNRYFEDNNQL